MTDELKVGDRVVIDPDQWAAGGKSQEIWPELDPSIEMTILHKIGNGKKGSVIVYEAVSDPCPCCGHRKQRMSGFAALWFKKIADAPAGMSQEPITKDVQDKMKALDAAAYERKATGPGTESE